MNLEQYKEAFKQVEQDFESSVEDFGLPYEKEESSPREKRTLCAQKSNFACENSSSSLWKNWISPACLACRTGEATSTFFVDLKCSRKCYFCFNPNQDYYEYFLSHKRDISAELLQAHQQGATFNCLAITGGEPLLHKEEVLKFIKLARQLYPQSHIRLYTSGDFLDSATLQDLAKAGLNEIRFSVKLNEGSKASELTFNLMKEACLYIPQVMIEMPVIPGTLESMKGLLLEADTVGIAGINLLEFCFPLHNAKEFKERGFKLRKRPYNHLYNYWYGGGIPVAHSEEEALQLIEFANEKQLALGIHYCSSDNKNTGQIYQQNKYFTKENSPLRRSYPWLSIDNDSYFLVCAKAFGSDILLLQTWLQAKGLPFKHEKDIPYISFPLGSTAEVKNVFPKLEIGKSYNVFEQDERGTFNLREISIKEL